MSHVYTTPTGANAGSAPKSSTSKSGKTKLTRVEIEPSANGGFSVKCIHRYADKSAGYDRYIEPEVYVYENAGSMFTALKSKLG